MCQTQSLNHRIGAVMCPTLPEPIVGYIILGRSPPRISGRQIIKGNLDHAGRCLGYSVSWTCVTESGPVIAVVQPDVVASLDPLRHIDAKSVLSGQHTYGRPLAG